MAADIRVTYHIRRWRLRRHLRQATLGAQVGLGALTIFTSSTATWTFPPPDFVSLAQALQVTLNCFVRVDKCPRATLERGPARLNRSASSTPAVPWPTIASISFLLARSGLGYDPVSWSVRWCWSSQQPSAAWPAGDGPPTSMPETVKPHC